MKYTAFIYENGAYRESFKVDLKDNMTLQEAEDSLLDVQADMLKSENDIITSYKVNKYWYTFVINSKNTLNKQLVELCNKLKTDIEVTGINPKTKYNYWYNTAIGCQY